jgi:hypothetical protein
MHAAHRLNASGHKSNILHVVQVDDHSSNIRVESRDWGSDAQRFSGIEINDSRTPTGYPANRFRLGTSFSTEPTIPFYANGEGWFNGTSSNTKAALKVTESGDRLFEVAPDNSTTFLLGDLDALGTESYIKGTYSDIQFHSEDGELVRIKSNGNVGIGTDNPGRKLSVAGGGFDMFADGGTSADVFTVTTHTYGFSDENEDSVYSYDGTNGHEFSTGGTQRLYIKQNGNVGIGVSVPRAKLDVDGGVRIANDSTAASATNVGTLRYRADSNNSYVDMVMQTGASTYEWVNIVQNNW